MGMIKAIILSLILSVCIPEVIGVNVVSNSMTTAAGTVSYSIDYGTGTLNQGSAVNTAAANDNLIQTSITGCSVSNADKITGNLAATDSKSNQADVSAEIDGPGASVTNYNLYAYVTPGLAWAGQYADSATGTNLNFKVIGQSTISGNLPYGWAGSIVSTHPSSSLAYTITNLYQDAMGGGFTPGSDGWAMSNIYSGTATVSSSDPNDWVDSYTGAYKLHEDSGGNAITDWGISSEGFSQHNMKIMGQSMGYADLSMGYTNIYGQDLSDQPGKQNAYTYYYYYPGQGIDKQDTIFW